MRIVITGSDGFIGRNLNIRLAELGHSEVIGINRTSSTAETSQALSTADFVFHLAGTNRPKSSTEFQIGNSELTQNICGLLLAANRSASIVLASSVQAKLDNPYGLSKYAAEQAVFEYGKIANANTYVFRLTNVFGKWAKPNYNSAVATFCHNTVNDIPILINDPSAELNLVYVDDVVEVFIKLLNSNTTNVAVNDFLDIAPIYKTTVGEVAEILTSFKNSRKSLTTDRVGTGFLRALYSTYISYLPPDLFAYSVPCHSDPRGSFVEMLKTKDSGQFSYFTAHPGVTRGQHYHHSKTEKFLVIKGTAHFGFRHILSGETHEIVTSGDTATVVETVPGWTHDITNIGTDELIVMLWANEVYQPEKPDTTFMPVKL